MKEQLFMAVDLGTSFIKTGVYDLNGRCLASASESVQDERPSAGVFIQRGDMLWESAKNCMKKITRSLGTDAERICAMAFTGQMAGSIGVDENWNDITTWSCSMDSRYLPSAEYQRKCFADQMFTIGGTNSPVMCAKYDWFRNEFPDEHKRIAKYMMLNGYMIGKLSKQPIDEAKIDTTLITWTGMADIARRSWSEELCSSMGIDIQHLPEIVASTSVGGYLDADIAAELGLKSGIPLVMGAGDKVSGCVGANVLHPGELIFEASSYGAISCMAEETRLDADKRNYDIIGAADGLHYYAHKYIQGSGIVIDWFVREFFDGDISKAEAAAEAAKGSGRMLSIGLLSGSAMPFDSEMRGAFLGHTLGNDRGGFYRALLEGFTYDLALTLESICSQYPEYKTDEIKLIGGGAKSAIWPQMLADVTGYRYSLLDRRDVALWGTAILAAAGVGATADITELSGRHVSKVKTFTPDAKANAAYAPYVRLYERCTRELHDIYAALNAL